MSEEEKDLINLKIAISPEKYIRELIEENKQLKVQCEIVEKRLVDEYEDMLDKRNKLFVENCKLKHKLECSQTNEETYRLEMLDITKILGLSEDALFDDVKQYAINLQQRIDKAIEYINGESPDAGVSGKQIKKILKGDPNERNII